MTPIEAIATALGVLCVALAAGRSVWTFPVGIAAVALLGWVVWRQRLYSDAVLQVFFVAANLYGWIGWRRSQVSDGAVVVGWMTGRERLGWAAGCAVATLAWGGAMARYTDAALPWWDAATAVVSVAAQLLMAQRRLENWLLWVAVDVALIPLYLVKDLPMIALLYLLYLGLSLWGLAAWRRAEQPA